MCLFVIRSSIDVFCWERFKFTLSILLVLIISPDSWLNPNWPNSIKTHIICVLRHFPLFPILVTSLPFFLCSSLSDGLPNDSSASLRAALCFWVFASSIDSLLDVLYQWLNVSGLHWPLVKSGVEDLMMSDLSLASICIFEVAGCMVTIGFFSKIPKYQYLICLLIKAKNYNLVNRSFCKNWEVFSFNPFPSGNQNYTL